LLDPTIYALAFFHPRQLIVYSDWTTIRNKNKLVKGSFHGCFWARFPFLPQCGLDMTIVHSSLPVTLVGGADLAPEDLKVALTLAPGLVAADGGAGAVLAAGLVPLAVIGDMDSLSSAAAAAFADLLHPLAEQETTDFDKTLRHVETPLVIAVGVTGGRFDHELAVMHALVRHPSRPCIVLGAQSIVFLCPPDLRLDLPPGSPFSLFPMGAVRVRSEGLLWPTEGICFAPDTAIGTSNAVAGPVRLRPDVALMLVILPREALPVAVGALAGQDGQRPATWSARSS
jgi:thiamine pyrophosphokinase